MIIFIVIHISHILFLSNLINKRMNVRFVDLFAKNIAYNTAYVKIPRILECCLYFVITILKKKTRVNNINIRVI